MFFENESLAFIIEDVLELKQENVNCFNSNRNFNAISFRFKGDTLLKTKDKEYSLKDNCVCITPARIDYTRIAKVDHLIAVHFECVNYSLKEIEFFLSKNPQKLSLLFKEILSVWNKKDTGYKYKCASLLNEILAECYRENYNGAHKNSKIKNSVEYIQKNYKNPSLSISQIASQSFMSEVYFRKLFKEEFKISPQKYIVNLRLQNAKGLILSGYYSLKEVAYLSGYTDYKYFSAEFKKQVGVSPKKYSYNFK